MVRGEETVRLVLSVDSPPTSSRSTSGVHESPVAPIERKEAGSNSSNLPMTERIMDGAGTYTQMLELARKFPSEMPAEKFVAGIFRGVSLKRPNTPIEVHLIDGRLGYWAIRARAMEWDHIGITKPIDFVEALECEITGTQRGDAVTDIISVRERSR